MPRRRLIPLVCAIACAAAFPAAAAATVTHDGSRTFRETITGHDFNICGFPGTFNMVISSEWHSTEANGGYSSGSTARAETPRPFGALRLVRGGRRGWPAGVRQRRR